MASENAKRDDNYVTTVLAVTNDANAEVRRLLIDPDTGRLLVNATGLGSSLSLEVPTGTVDGSNTSFTVSNEPVVVIIDGLVRRPTKGYTYSSGTITVDPLSPPTYDIFSLY